MAIRKILVSVDGSAAARPVLETALAVGRRLSAHVEALHVRPDPRDSIPLVGEGMSGAMIEELITITETEGAARAGKARALFEQACAAGAVPVAVTPAAAGFSAAWREETGREDETMAVHGRLADLVVVGRPTVESDAAARMTLNAVLFETGRPVLVAPAQPPATLGRTVAIAWNGSAEAARAIGAALPLIERAEATAVLSIASGGAEDGSAADVVGYLGWHGIAAEGRMVNADGGLGGIGEALLAACAGVDLLVMGAYTHSRWRELILGGTTRHVLEHASMSLLMAH
ncbi:MAG: universal stress protein [Rhodospirillales bacterium]